MCGGLLWLLLFCRSYLCSEHCNALDGPQNNIGLCTHTTAQTPSTTPLSLPKKIKDEMDEEEAVAGHIGRSRRMLADMYETGGAVLAGMGASRERLKLGGGPRPTRHHPLAPTS